MNRRAFLTTIAATVSAGCSTIGSRSTPTPRLKTVFRTPPGSVSKEEYEALNESYHRLKERYKTLETEHRELQRTTVEDTDYEDLKARYADLRADYRQLQDATGDAAFPPYVVARDREFLIAYTLLDKGTRFYTVPSAELERQINLGTYMRSLTFRQLSYLGWTDVIDRFEGDSKYQTLGEFGTFYQLNPFVVIGNFTTLAADVYNRHSNDSARIREIWNFVTQLNAYTCDEEEEPRMPMETQLLGGGDCEDTAILAGSMLAAMPAPWRVQFVHTDYDNPADPQKIDHVIIAVEPDDGQVFVETTNPLEMNPFDEVNGFWTDVVGPANR